MIATAMSSTAGTAVIPMQDWLGLGREARMNFPSTLGDNWKWRLTDGQLTDALAAHMKDVTETYCRGSALTNKKSRRAAALRDFVCVDREHLYPLPDPIIV